MPLRHFRYIINPSFCVQFLYRSKCTNGTLHFHILLQMNENMKCLVHEKCNLGHARNFPSKPSLFGRTTTHPPGVHQGPVVGPDVVVVSPLQSHISIHHSPNTSAPPLLLQQL